MAENGLTKREEVLPVTQRGILTAEALKAETEQRALLAEYIAHHMHEETDFGLIPGTKKPTLLKPGAEKLVDLFRCTPKYKLVKCIEDFDKGFFSYIFSVKLIQRDSGSVLAEGYGSANSREGRYRWRDAQRKCPKCGKATIFTSKNPGEGFYCWRKKDGCGATFGLDDLSVASQVAGKIENDDIATLANTILKMAKKRATVDGAIALARCSDMFTQDMEDDIPPEPAPAPAQPEGRRQTGPPAKTPADAHAEAALRSRVHHLWERAKSAGVTSDGFKLWVSVTLGVNAKPSADLSASDIDALEAALPELLRDWEVSSRA